MTNVDLDISLSEFVRYILTGFNSLLFIIILPISYLQPDILLYLLSEASFLTIALLSLCVGYLLDILKIYQFSPHFKVKRAQFRDEIANILGIPKEQVSSYFSMVSKVWGKYSPYDLERRRSEWVLMLHTAIILDVSVIVWGTILMYQYFRSISGVWLIVPVVAIVLSLLASIRLFKIADREREKSNEDFLLILENNKEKILDSWKLWLDKYEGEN